MLTTIFLDFDKTITNSRKEITLRTRAAIKQVQVKGYRVGLCTGRQLISLRSRLSLLEFFSANQTHIFSGGAQIITTVGEIIWQKLIAATTVKQIFEQANLNDVVLTSSTVSFNANQACVVGNNKQTLEDFAKRHHLIKKELILTQSYNQQLPLVIVDEINEQFLQFLEKNKLELNFKTMLGYDGTVYADITAKDVNKGNALEVWSRLNETPLTEIAMVGDSENDLEALQVVGYPIIMGNATDALTKFGFHQIDTNDNDGLAFWLESLPVINGASGNKND
ncbi:MAG: HAD family hydrolase [bacterium]|nr:HAD family hydrolase [bacterium]